MASTISAGTTSGTALNMSADTTGSLILATSGTTALTIGTTQNATFAGSVNSINTFGFKNLLINAGFIINQRAYVSAATLSSGTYGHDRWKAGSSGGDYSFTQGTTSTTITIASGKSLIQVVENVNVNGTSFVLSWTGTAQARYAVNSATPAGSYASSPIIITGQTAGTTMSVEFNAGTLTNPQLELGSQATIFDYRDYGRELLLCQRYYCTFPNGTNGGGLFITATTDNYRRTNLTWPVQMRTNPTVTPTFSGGSGAGSASDQYQCYVYVNAGNTTSALNLNSVTASAEL